MDIQLGKVDAPMVAQGLQALAHTGQGILGQEDEGWAAKVNGEVAQARGAGGDRHGHIESKPGLTGLRRASNDTYGRPGPQRADEPVVRGWRVGDVDRADDWQGLGLRFGGRRQTCGFGIAGWLGLTCGRASVNET